MQQFLIYYATGNSSRTVGAVNGAENGEEALAAWAEANGLKLNARNEPKGRTGHFGTELVSGSSEFVFVRPFVVHAGTNRAHEAIEARQGQWPSITIHALPAGDLVPEPIVTIFRSDSEPIADSKSETISEPKSEIKSRYEIQPGLTVIDVENDPEYAPQAAAIKAQIVAEREDGLEPLRAAIAAGFAAQDQPKQQPKAHLEVAQIVAELDQLDWELVAAAKEPGDRPFWTIIALRHRPVFECSPYVVCSFNYSGISWGHYDLDRERAFRVFNEKVAEREEV